MAEDERSDNAAREDGHADNARGLAGPRFRSSLHIRRITPRTAVTVKNQEQCSIES